ncbi:signal peptidase I [Dokdonella sp.]|uniref:signal peptidase I n=1 Tax=Dokdonella sp. TaxID=2291710 RepID=UPI001B0D20E5|nr:signal peptidase I [Dokdonella sp.]MBO9664463.1 signal peptidase I [Dokdonella sp.]
MRNWLRDNRHFFAILLLFGFVRTAVADWNPVPSGSMRPTILEGDVVFVNRLAYDLKLPLTDRILAHLGEPRRGDIITFSSPADGTRLIKRIAAVPGDTIAMRGNRLTINGAAIDYAPLGEVVETLGGSRQVRAERARETFGADAHTVQWLQGARSRSSFAPLTIPPDHYLMLGDNRDDSEDSRYFGLVPRERLIGRAERILVSADIEDRWQLRFDRFGRRFDD